MFKFPLVPFIYRLDCTFQWDDDDNVRFALDKCAEFNFYCVIELQQEPDDRRVTQFGHNILTPSQSVALLYRYSVCKHFANGIEKDRNKKSSRCLMPLSTIFWKRNQEYLEKYNQTGEWHWLEIRKVSETYHHFQQYFRDFVIEESEVTGENHEPAWSCDKLLSNELSDRHYPYYIFTSISASPIRWAVILVPIDTFKTDVIVSNGEVIMCLMSDWLILFSMRVTNLPNILWIRSVQLSRLYQRLKSKGKCRIYRYTYLSIIYLFLSVSLSAAKVNCFIWGSGGFNVNEHFFDESWIV